MRIERGSVATEIDAGSQPGRRPVAVPSRSRLTNHKDMLPGLDGRSAVARRFRDICCALASDQGGLDAMSEARLQLTRRFAALCVHAEALESRLANGERIDIAEHARLSSTLVRIAKRVGLNRMPRDVTPNLAEYLEARDAALDAEEADA